MRFWWLGLIALVAGCSGARLDSTPIGTSLSDFEARAKQVGCQMSTGRGPLDSYQRVYQCESGERYSTGWGRDDRLQVIERVRP